MMGPRESWFGSPETNVGEDVKGLANKLADQFLCFGKDIMPPVGYHLSHLNHSLQAAVALPLHSERTLDDRVVAGKLAS
jgi:hypothetical protein